MGKLMHSGDIIDYNASFTPTCRGNEMVLRVREDAIPDGEPIQLYRPGYITSWGAFDPSVYELVAVTDTIEAAQDILFGKRRMQMLRLRGLL